MLISRSTELYKQYWETALPWPYKKRNNTMNWLKIIGNIAAAVGVSLAALSTGPVWVVYLGIGLKALADGLRSAQKIHSGE